MIQTKKRNRVQAKIFDRTAHTGTQSASACIHASTEIALKQHYFCAVKIALHRNFLRITFNFASQNFDFASQTAMRYRINSSLSYMGRLQGLRVNVKILTVMMEKINDFTTMRLRGRDLIPLLVLQSRTLSSCHVLPQVRVGQLLVALLLV